MQLVFALFLGFVTFLWPHRGDSETAQVTVFAAASLRGPLEEIAATFEAPVVLSYGGSGTIARQVAAGAPVDVLVLASPLWMGRFGAEARVKIHQTQPIAGNELVVIGPKGSAEIDDIQSLEQRLGAHRLAMGQRDAVPAGSYARQWLERANLWDALSSRLAETDNVRAALALVARAQAPFGVVYASDAAADPSVTVIYKIPAHMHDPILYPAAALSARGRAFLAHLSAPAATRVFLRHGLKPPPK